MCCGTRWSRHKFSIRSVHIITSCVRHQHHKWVFRNIKPTGFARNKKDERVWTLMRRKLILQVCFLFTDFLHTVYRPLSQWPNRVQILMSMVFTEAHVKQSTVSCPGVISIRVLPESTSPHNPSAQPKFFIDSLIIWSLTNLCIPYEWKWRDFMMPSRTPRTLSILRREHSR